jgi:two-component system KDP operon response regulator KdpE
MLGRKRRLLVVDDEVGLQRMVRRYVEAAGFDVCTADTAAEGVALAASVRPDAILLDLTLPDGDGLDVVARLKQRPETAAIPIVVWSGSDVTESSRRAFQAGAIGYFDKVDMADLMVKLSELLGP